MANNLIRLQTGDTIVQELNENVFQGIPAGIIRRGDMFFTYATAEYEGTGNDRHRVLVYKQARVMEVSTD